ncbi:MAG: efflux RND transporter periplasmic adaptor subunit [Planctomycetota bacterium]
MKRFVVGLAGGLLTAIVVIIALVPLLVQTPLAERLSGTTEPDLQVLVERAGVGSLTRTINAPGEIEAETNVEISAQVSARVVELPFDEGDAIAADDVIVRLDDRDLAAALDAARAQMLADEARLLGAQAELEESRAEATRQRSLYESRDTSLSIFESAVARERRAESTAAQIEHAIAIARARIRQAERDLDNTVIRSPIDGVLTRRQAEVGELVVVGTLNNPASVIMEIADLSRMLVQARIDESNIALVERGQRATVYLNAFSERSFDAEVTFVGLARQLWRDGSGYVAAEVLLQDEGESRLQTGLTANVDIEVETLEDVVRIPSQAVIDRRIEDLPLKVVEGSDIIEGGRTFTRVVYILDDAGRASVRPVVIGPSDLTHTVVLAGLEPDEPVIVGPFRVLQELRDGKPVSRISEVGAEGDDGTADGADG